MKRKLKVPGLRRPSAAMLVAVTALFLSLGGVGYAAVALPNNSVGAAQLKATSVGTAAIKGQAITNTKIKLGAVGYARVNQSEVQLRVTGTCTTAGQAITSVAQTGKVTCATAAPAEFDSGVGTSVALTSATAPATVASYAVAGGSAYLVQADPYVTVTPATTDTGTDQVTVTCTLAAGTSTSSTQTRSVTIDATATGGAVHSSVPLTVTEPSSTNSSTTDVTCTSSPTTGQTPTVTAQSTIYSLQTSSNTSVS